ncbi:MAG: DUF5915 domain-containing protein, partial [Bacteroidota bacterium]|nr:DUF5915 domain-containing protein [Bacteroidota bacterium]
IDKDLEERMQFAQQISSQALSLRKKLNIRVRQPLNKIMIPASSEKFISQIEKVKDLILSEINVKEVEFLSDTEGVLVKSIKPNFKTLGPKYGKMMKLISKAFAGMEQEDINSLEKTGEFVFDIQGEKITVVAEDADVVTEDIPGLAVSNVNNITVAMDIDITPKLKEEGLARELINRIQNLRKDLGFEVTDHIDVIIENNKIINSAVENNFSYICSETLTKSLGFEDAVSGENTTVIELEEGLSTTILVQKH